jgi:Tol biopolymer transport system component
MFISFTVVFISYAQQDYLPILSGPYLGQKPPGKKPEIFAPGIVSTEKNEINAVFSPDGKSFYFSRDTYSKLSKAGRDYTIFFMKKTENGWTKPEKVSFAGDYMNADMVISFDGKQLFFCSDRPLLESGQRKQDSDIWVVDVSNDSWSKPKNLGININSSQNEWYPCLTQNGTLYFSSSREDGLGKSDLYCVKLAKGVYQRAQPLKGSINTQFREGDAYISPDEKFLIVTSSDRPDTFGKGDLYISYRNEDGQWSEAINMGNTINSPAHDYCPMLSFDQKYLFFSSKKRGQDDIYWVDARIIEDLKPKDLN